MTTADLRAAQLDIREHWSDALSIQFTFVDAGNDPVNVSGYVISASIWQRGAELQAVKVASEGVNVRRLSLTSAQMTALRYQQGLTWMLRARSLSVESTPT